MTNTKAKRDIIDRKDFSYVNTSSDISSGENERTYNIDSWQCINSTDNDCLVETFVDDNCVDGHSDDVDEINNDSDTSSSFSLQECMNEFRARRIRRSSLPKHRQELNKACSNKGNSISSTELDLINQNLCNKQQERKCKPCQNGFCYCFTSDSGDGCRKLPPRNSRVKRTEYIQFLNDGKNTANSPQSKYVYGKGSYEQNASRSNASFLKTTEKGSKNLKAISSIETSTKDGPLIHITQELRDKCVISKVKVNKYRMAPFEYKIMEVKNPFRPEQTAEKYFKTINHAPTAPMPDEFVNNRATDGVRSILETNKSRPVSSAKLRNLRGKLLRKRISASNPNYCNRNGIKNAPPKPPRNSIYENNNFTSTSSVRHAELVIDDFLARYDKKIDVKATTDLKSVTKGELSKNGQSIECAKNKAYPHPSKKQTENMFKHVSISDVEGVIEPENIQLYDKVSEDTMNNLKKVTSNGWNEGKINDMLNYEAYTKHKEFYSVCSQAQPQQYSSTDIERNGKTFGWKIPSKINLDTVDGIVNHNLATNCEDKVTPMKEKIILPSQNSKGKFSCNKWSEQLRHLSPWTTKSKINESNSPKNKHCCSSMAFISSSRKKILSLVSPKKKNGERYNLNLIKTSHRNVSIQTSSNDISGSDTNIHSQPAAVPQSPPGSYHSPMKSSQNTSPNKAKAVSTHFDFSRTVHSPNRKSSRSGQRKLNFPLDCAFPCKDATSPSNDISGSSEGIYQNKTYHSFSSELDQDLSISKINYILNNIREKLEANDQQAVTTFKEAKSSANCNSLSFDCPDSQHRELVEDGQQLHKCSKASQTKIYNLKDPIYSEIENGSCSEFDDHAGIQHFFATDNPEVLYAKVNKSNKHVINTKKQKEDISLAKIIKDSLKRKKSISNFVPLPTLLEPTGVESISYPLPHCQSLNNLQVVEYDSSKKQQNLSKSDLSLHRSEIFLDNLCKNDLVIDADYNRENYEKVQNNKPIISYVAMASPSPNGIFCTLPELGQHILHNDSVSYELPDDEIDGFSKLADTNNSTTAGSNMCSSTVVLPSPSKQNTPKKQSFVTKDESNTREFNVDEETEDNKYNLNDSCSDEVFEYESMINSNVLQRYNSLKTVFHNSFRKSKTFMRKRGKRLSTSLKFTLKNAALSPSLAIGKQSCTNSTPNLDDMFFISESATIADQIAQAVTICRTLPDLEVSMEMVEAERLLLCSALRRDNKFSLSSAAVRKNHMIQKRFFIDDIYLPVISEVNQDIFFNYFYIITFECGGIIKSTQPAECVNDTVVFHENGIELIHCSELQADDDKHCAIKCSVFMLRLRKISNILIEPKKKTADATVKQNSPATSKSTSSSSSFNEVVSRFCLQASFTLDAKDFVPYEYLHQESKYSDRVFIRASCFCTLPLTYATKRTNLTGELFLKGKSEVHFPKTTFNGFLNVQDPQMQHNWNRRWCTLEGIFLYIWKDKNNLNTAPIITIDLRDSKHNIKYPLICSPREICARPRSFCLKCKISKSNEELYTIILAADTQENLEDWLRNLNIVLDFIARWL